MGSSIPLAAQLTLSTLTWQNSSERTVPTTEYLFPISKKIRRKYLIQKFSVTKLVASGEFSEQPTNRSVKRKSGISAERATKVDFKPQLNKGKVSEFYVSLVSGKFSIEL